MQKIIKLETENTPLERWTENSACEIYSHDTNNGYFEIEVMNEALTDETVTALFIFEESQSVWRTEGSIEENKIKFKFDTTLITQDETVICVLYLDNERENNDFYRFNFKVKVSEIDKLDNLTIKERLFKNNLIIDRLEVVTKDELKEALKTIDLSNISTEGLLTEEKANGLYAKISQLEAVESKLITQEQLTSTKNDVVTEINNRLENYALKTNIPEPYNDTSLVSRVSNLENKQDKDTVYDDSELKARISVLESREDNNTIYDDTSVRERLAVLENKTNVDISNLATKDELNEVRNSQPTVDTSNLVTRDELENKHYLTTHQDITGLATKEELANLITSDQLEAKHYITGAALENYALKSDIPQGYNDSEVKERLTVLENKQDKDTIYNDEPIKERLTALENKPNIDLTGYATKEELKAKVNTSDYDTFKSMVVTKGYLDSKNYLTTPYNDTELIGRVTTLENKPPVDLSNYATKQELQEATEIDYSQIVTHEELEAKHYLTANNLANYALKSEIPQQYNDTALVSRVSVLESKQDKDTIYNDTEVKQRLTALESRPTTTQWEIHGTGMPNGVVEAEIGTTYVDKNKTNGALKWIKTTNGGNTGWRVFTGDTGWRTLPLVNKRGTARLQIRRINDEIIVKFDGLSWGWFGVDDIAKQGGNIIDKTIAGKKYTWIKLNIGQGNNVLPVGFRSASSLLSGLYGDLGDLLGSVYVGGTADSNAIQLRYAMDRNQLTSNILSQIRISPITFITDDDWPTQLP